MAPGTCLTVGVPRLPSAEIRGIRLAPRGRTLAGIDLERVATVPSDGEETSVWRVAFEPPMEFVRPEDDVALYAQGWIVVTPMRVDEHGAGGSDDPELEAALPRWPGG